ncbi:MAG: transcriptional repressor [Firmicutes bacterium]|nr:transcriptional repressor [Bacillota bacterium]
MGKKRVGFVRRTKQRELILRVLRGTTCHPTADWIYQEVRKELPNVSLGTIYRNLRCLREMGEVLELSYGSSYSRYDGNPEPHYHFICNICGSVFDVNMTVIHDLEKLVADATGFDVREHRMEFYGYCDDCTAEEQDGKTMCLQEDSLGEDVQQLQAK